MDILFENPLLIAMIIGIISAVFGKIGKQEEKEQNKPAPQREPMPQKQTASSTHPHPVRTDQLDDFGDVHDHGGMKKTSESLQDRYSDTLAKMDERKSKLQEEFQLLERQLTRPKATAAEVKPEVIEKINQNTVVQGMILGEVFGEPRSKKPHRTMKRRYNR
ncbi:hypothetical protein QUF51_11505 [Bacillus pumilus]|nr:hypothetical protein [Bacillus pumilus]OLP65538.1 hypothetical protein BACPU_16260 [Bacillus pumilus]